jgi:hypothetical protein
VKSRLREGSFSKRLGEVRKNRSRKEEGNDLGHISLETIPIPFGQVNPPKVEENQ